MTNQEIIVLLINIGEQIDSGDVLVDLKLLEDCSHINAMTPYSWKSAIARYPTEKLFSLLKGLTYVEEELSWMGGSVCGCIWILGALRSRGTSIEDIDQISAWVIKNTSNPWNPFGGQNNKGAKNFTEYLKLDREYQERLNHDAQMAIERGADNRENRRKTREYSASRRNTPERDLLIRKLNEMSVRDQLILISKDELHSLTFYPTRCAGLADNAVIDSLSKEVKKALKDKLYGRQRGPWLGFKRRLYIKCGWIRGRWTG